MSATALASDANLLAVREHRRQRQQARQGDRTKACLLLPGSRASEISRLLPVFDEAVLEIAARNPGTRFLLPTVPRQERRVRELTAAWKVQPEISVDSEMKWRAYSEADTAIAASGTVILELALAGVPVVSTYRADWLVTLLHEKIRIWTAALPNLIADFPIVPEYFNKAIRRRDAQPLVREAFERHAAARRHARWLRDSATAHGNRQPAGREGGRNRP
ncbi:lipid A disaccharide synthetase [Sinorhizobium fredii]